MADLEAMPHGKQRCSLERGTGWNAGIVANSPDVPERALILIGKYQHASWILERPSFGLRPRCALGLVSSTEH
jgi:hypothetical protein